MKSQECSQYKKPSVVGEPLKTKPEQRVGLRCWFKTVVGKKEKLSPVLKGDRRATDGEYRLQLTVFWVEGIEGMSLVWLIGELDGAGEKATVRSGLEGDRRASYGWEGRPKMRMVRVEP
ncbi:hypothetical protein PIB30_065208 [Stylosanthes scabra]|uniref:Uncharacterized protein n=1 Tax=Stylosanthes scabra TaxID=79078 RepID=A0ABU6SNA6_9FABA|nr:hypothetical protein [Stylosanthes scabra]